MQSLQYAFRFIRASLSLAIENTRLLKPWLHLSLGSMALIIIWFFPLALVVGLIGLRPVSMILVGLICIFVFFSLLVWGEITALQTSQTFSKLIQGNDQFSVPESPGQVMASHWFDVFLYVLIFPGEKILHIVRYLFKKDTNNLPVWINVHYLIVPVISLEDLDLAQAVVRVRQIIRDNLLRFNADLVRVRLIARIVQWFLLVCGVYLGFVAAVNIANPATAGLWRRIFGLAVGLVLGGVPTIIGILFSTFTRACYYTSLYQWVRNVETARRTGNAGTASPPAILRQVLGKSSSSKKEQENAAKTGSAQLD